VVNADCDFSAYTKKNIIREPELLDCAGWVVAVESPCMTRARIKAGWSSAHTQSYRARAKTASTSCWDQTKSIFNATDYKPPAQVHQADRLST